MTVKQLLDAVLPRLSAPALSFMEAVNAATAVLFQRLVALEADLVKAPLSLAFTAQAPVAVLPADFRGLAELPYLVGQDAPLTPYARNARAADDGQTAATPQHYEVLGDSLYLRRPPATDQALKGLYFRWPGEVAALSDTLPYAGVFDPLYREAVPRICQEGYGIVADPAFDLFIAQQVDHLLPKRNSHQPLRRRVRDF